MLLRAVFWISVVAILMPHEPDLGLGRPSVTGTAAEGLRHADCGSQRATCAVAMSALDSFQSIAVRSLKDVKADIEEAQREAGPGLKPRD